MHVNILLLKMVQNYKNRSIFSRDMIINVLSLFLNHGVYNLTYLTCFISYASTCTAVISE